LKSDSIRTKLNVFTLVVILVLAGGIASVYLADIYLSDTQNTYSTKITNSKGGVWNATEANLRSALNSVGNSTPGWISLPVGATITTMDRLDVWNYTTVYGNGATIRLGTAANCAVIGINGKTSGGSVNDGEHHINIYDLNIDGNNGSQTWNQYYFGIMITGNSNNITIRNVNINNTCTDGIWIYSISGQTGAKYITVDDCMVRDIHKYVGDFPGGVYCGGAFCKIINSDFIDCWGSGIVLENWNHPQYCHNNIVQGNTITGETSTGVWFESDHGHNNSANFNHIYKLNSTCYLASSTVYSRAMTLGQDDCDAIGNIIENVTDYAVDIDGVRVLFSGNRIMNVIGGAHSVKGTPIYIISPGTDYTISDCTIYGFTRYGIDTRSRGKIEGCTIYGGSRGVSISGFNNITIDGNKFYGCTDGILMSTTSRNIIITDNKFGGCTDGIHFSGTPRYLTILGNDLLNCTTNAINYAVQPTNSYIALNQGSSSMQIPTSVPTYLIAGAMYVNATTGDIAVYSGAAWIWTHG
jgi:parallel beta-helix repeat protein